MIHTEVFHRCFLGSVPMVPSHLGSLGCLNSTIRLGGLRLLPLVGLACLVLLLWVLGRLDSELHRFLVVVVFFPLDTLHGLPRRLTEEILKVCAHHMWELL